MFRQNFSEFDFMKYGASCVAVLGGMVVATTGMATASGFKEYLNEPLESPVETLRTDLSYSGEARLAKGSDRIGNISVFQSDFNYSLTFEPSKTFSYELGLFYERFSLAVPDGGLTPSTLQSVGVSFGTKWQFADKWTLQAAAFPGLYSDFRDISFSDVRVTFYVGVSYAVSRDLQWVAGLIADPNGDIPVLGGIGARWKFAEKWTLVAILPKPAVEYQVSETLTAYFRGTLLGSSYRVAKDFGQTHGRPDLDDALVTYREIRVGTGFRCSVGKRLVSELEGGWTINRRFAYREQHLQLNGRGAPYVAGTLRFSF